MNSISDILVRKKMFENELPPFPEDGAQGLESLAKMIDHTLLKPEAIPEAIERLCAEALEYSFGAVCINPIHVSRAANFLKGSPVAVCTVVGFPLGAVPTATKVFEAERAIGEGAIEIDMVLSIGLLKADMAAEVMEDISALARAVHAGGGLLKVILETCLLTRGEKILASLLAVEAGADFVKTSTGFSTGGATVEDVELMRRVVGSPSRVGVKASGGVRSLADARTMLQAGANRLGTSSGVKIITEALHE